MYLFILILSNVLALFVVLGNNDFTHIIKMGGVLISISQIVGGGGRPL